MPRQRAAYRKSASRGRKPRGEALNQVALAAALIPIVTIDSLGTVQSVSDSIERVFGWKPAELIGKNVKMLMPEPHRSAHDGYLGRYLSTGVTNILNRPRRFEAMRKDGQLVPIELSVTRADIPGRGAPLFVALVRDLRGCGTDVAVEGVTADLHEMLAEQTTALQTAHMRLRMADRMASLGALAAGLGHDMNNMLLPVRARLNALRAAELPAAANRLVDGIASGITYLQQLADGLHYLTLDPERDEFSDSKTELKQWWDQTGALLSKAVPKHVRVSADFQQGLPPVRVAAHALTQVVLNLIVNSGEAIPASTKRRQGHVRISAEASPDRSQIRLSVRDNGDGMTPEVLRRAFEMFFTTKARGLGTGLGLALVRRVVDRAGGEIEIDSHPGKGTSVDLVLPSAEAPRLTGSSRSQIANVSIGDSRAAALFHSLFEAAGISVTGRTNANRADIWVVDPRKDALAAAITWRKRQPRGQLIVFGRIERGLQTQWQALKPIVIVNCDNFEEVRAAVARVIGLP